MMHGASCMLNLTYDDDHLPKYGQLVKSDVQKFFKRLRFNTGKFRYVASGEYGDVSRRPHFHIALFGMDFSSNRKPMGKSVSGDQCFISDEVAKSWTLGNHLIGKLNFESAAYISRYIMKKIKGDNLCPLPLHVDRDTGEVVYPNPEFLIMSQGIGKSWFRDFFMSDVFPHARVITPQGTPAPVPRYYKNLLKEVGTDLAMDMYSRTVPKLYENLDRTIFENQPSRKTARDTVARARSTLFKRNVGD